MILLDLLFYLAMPLFWVSLMLVRFRVPISFLGYIAGIVLMAIVPRECKFHRFIWPYYYCISGAFLCFVAAFTGPWPEAPHWLKEALEGKK